MKKLVFPMKNDREYFWLIQMIWKVTFPTPYMINRVQPIWNILNYICTHIVKITKCLHSHSVMLIEKWDTVITNSLQNVFNKCQKHDKSVVFEFAFLPFLAATLWVNFHFGIYNKGAFFCIFKTCYLWESPLALGKKKYASSKSNSDTVQFITGVIQEAKCAN